MVKEVIDLSGDRPVQRIRAAFDVIASRSKGYKLRSKNLSSAPFGGYEVSGLFRARAHGLRLESINPRRFLLELMVGPGRRARIVKTSSGIWLAHSGAVHRDSKKPHTNSKVVIGRKQFFLIGKMNDPDLWRKIVKFHDSRGRSNPRGLPFRKAKDRGATKAHLRIGSDVEPVHHKIVDAIEKVAQDSGWKLASSAKLRPDLLLRKGRRRILFEIKARGTQGEMAAGLGQLLIYGEANKCRELVLACPLNRNAEGMRKALSARKIRVVDVSVSGKNITFPAVESLLSV